MGTSKNTTAATLDHSEPDAPPDKLLVKCKGGYTAAVNVRCLEGIDLASIPVTEFDGRAPQGDEARTADQRGRKHAWSPGGLLRVWTKG